MPVWAQSPTPVEYKPTRAGGGGALGTLFWQAPILLNSHFTDEGVGA
jgi:peptide/nickel transport system substrate-binding protein